jgi:hypothetical protein
MKPLVLNAHAQTDPQSTQFLDGELHSLCGRLICPLIPDTLKDKTHNYSEL